MTDSSSPLTWPQDFSAASIAVELSTAADRNEGLIADDAAHWQIEPFLPLDAIDLRRMLDRRMPTPQIPDSRGPGGPDGHAGAATSEICGVTWDRSLRRIDDHLDRWAGGCSRRIMTAYRGFDPDRVAPPETSGSNPEAPDQSASAENHDPTGDCTQNSTRVAAEVERLAIAAGYSKVPRDQIEQCVGIASQWGVPLNIDFDAFARLDVYARGDVIGYRTRRNLRSMYRRQILEVPVYRKMVVLFEMKGDAKYIEASPDQQTTSHPGHSAAASSAGSQPIHLRLFKNIPKQDVDMLLPTARVKISGVDRLKIVLPSLGGFLMSLRKIAQFTLLLAALALHWVAILIAIAIGYAIKSTLSYFQTRNRYQLNLTKNLYFQKIGAGDVVLTTLVAQAAQQRRVEAMLALSAIRQQNGCDDDLDEPISTRRLKRRCQRLIREGLGIEVEFRVDRAVSLLVDVGLVRRDGDRWRSTAQKSHDRRDRSTDSKSVCNPAEDRDVVFGSHPAAEN